MLYNLEQRVEGTWQLLQEVTDLAVWENIRGQSGSFRLLNPRTGYVEREVHNLAPIKSL